MTITTNDFVEETKGKIYAVPIQQAINPDNLHAQLTAALGSKFAGVGTTPTGAKLIFKSLLQGADLTTLNTVLAAHNASQLTAEQQKIVNDNTAQDDVRTRWAASLLHNKTPAQIRTFISGKITAWASLADAKADLNAWLPDLFAAVAWIVMKEQQRD